MNSVSVIITTYNRKYEVRRALDSIYAQTVLPGEIILVDDASTDGTKEYISFFSYEKLRYICMEQHSGAGKARNTGIENASGEFIAFLDSDNEWMPSKQEEFQNYLNSDIDVVFSKYRKHIQFGTVDYPKSIPYKTYALNQEILIHNIVDASAAIYSKKFLSEVAGFDENMKTNIDWDIILRASMQKEIKLSKINKVLSENRTMYDSLSENMEQELTDRFSLLKKYESNILECGYEIAVYETFVTDMLDYMTKYEATKLFMNKMNYEPQWVDAILKYNQNIEEKQCGLIQRKDSFYNLLYSWLNAKLSKNTIADYLLKKKYKSIAIYGAGKHGSLLFQELLQSAVSVSYWIDGNKSVEERLGTKVYGLEEKLPTVDAIVVTPYLEYYSIKKKIEERISVPVISLEVIIQGIL